MSTMELEQMRAPRRGNHRILFSKLVHGFFRRVEDDKGKVFRNIFDPKTGITSTFIVLSDGTIEVYSEVIPPDTKVAIIISRNLGLTEKQA